MTERTRVALPPVQSESENRIEKFVSILIATVTILAAVTAFMQTYASTQASSANRRAQDYSIQATTRRLSGAVQFSYDWQGAFQTWRELDLQIIAAQQDGDLATADRYRALRDRIVPLSPLLQPPYFDPQTLWPDPARYEAELYLVDSTRAREHFAAEAALGNAWDSIATAFVVQLTLLAVTLSLYGLSTTISSWVRWLFLGVGTSLAFLCTGWLAVSLIFQPSILPDPAIEAYAQGVGLAWQSRHQDAVAQFDQALALAPDYANAYYERGNAHYNLGQYEQAAADYVLAGDYGRDDANVGWNLGWIYYLLGRYDQAIQTDQRVLERDPTVVGVRMNLALALLAQGRFDEARADYERALQEATRQVQQARSAGSEPPSSLWYYLEAGALDIENLLDQLAGTPQPWTQAPDAALVTADLAALQGVAQEQVKRIKEHTVALEFNGQPPGGITSANISDFQFGQEVHDSQGNFVRYETSDKFLYGTNDMVVLFDYVGFRDGQHEVWKVYLNGQEDPSLRVVGSWSIGESGRGAKSITYAYSNVFIFTPGEYVVELYVDSELLRRGTFYVLEE
jgi:tetratricopeptide (TPR) repeat protein